MNKPERLQRVDILCARLRQITEPWKDFGKLNVEMTDKKMTRAIKTSLNSKNNDGKPNKTDGGINDIN